MFCLKKLAEIIHVQYSIEGIVVIWFTISMNTLVKSFQTPELEAQSQTSAHESLTQINHNHNHSRVLVEGLMECQFVYLK